MAWTRAQIRRKSITYHDDQNPQKRRLFASLAPVGYEDSEGQIQQIDMTPARVNVAGFNGWRVVNNGWHYGLTTTGQVWFGGKRGQHIFKFRLHRVGYTQVDQGVKPDFAQDFTDIGGAPTYNTANLSQTARTQALPDGEAVIGTLAEWRDLWPALPVGEIYARWAVSGDRLKEEIVITQAAREWIAANRPPAYYGLQAAQTWLTFAFQIDFSDIPKRFLRGAGEVTGSEDFSDSAGELEGRTALDELLFFMPLDDAYVDETIDTGRIDTGGNPIYETRRTKTPLRKRFWRNADGQWYLVIGARVSNLAAMPAGDLVFDPTLNESVAASSDDAYIDQFAGYNDSHDTLLLGGVGGSIANAGQGWRFDGIALSGSDTVDSVKLTAVNANTVWTTIANRWTFEDSDDAATFSSGSPPGARSIVATIVTDENNFSQTNGTAYDFPRSTADQDSLAGALQNVIDRAGWSSGNAIALINNSNLDSSQFENFSRTAYATYDHPTYAAPALTIEYTAGGGGPTAYTQDVSGSASSAGVMAREARKTFTGTGAGAGALATAAAFVRALAGASSAAGAISREAQKVISGVGSGAGALARVVAYVRAVAGGSSAAGSINRLVDRAVSGAGAGAGALASIRVFVRAFEGAAAGAGSISRQVNKGLAGAGSGLGAISKAVIRALSGAGSGAGVLEAIKTTGLILVELTGASSAAGAISREINRGIVGASAGVGALNRAVSRVVAGAGAGSGTLASIRVFTMVLEGAASSAGAIGRQINKSLAGVSTGAGVIGRAISRALSGAAAGVGALVAQFGLQNQPGRAGATDTLKYGASVDVQGVGNAESTVSDGDIS